jgi:hypothetical protein
MGMASNYYMGERHSGARSQDSGTEHGSFLGGIEIGIGIGFG